MNFIRRILFCWLASLCLTQNIAANSLPLNGAAKYSDLGKDKFIAALYLEQFSGDRENIIFSELGKRMEMRLSTSYSKRRWTNLWMQSIAISNSNKEFNNAAESLVELFNSQQGGVQAGDIVALHCDADSSCSYQINNVTLASDLPRNVFKLFVNAWIGKAPPSVSFRNAILGYSDDTALMLIELNEIEPTEERIATIEDWVVPAEPEIDEAELQRLAEQKAAEEKAAEALAQAKIAEEKAKLAAATPKHVGLFNTEEPDPAAIALASAERLSQQAEEEKQVAELSAEPASEQQAIHIPSKNSLAQSDESEQEISVESILAMKNYIKSTKKQIYKSIKYPTTALRNGYQGQVRLKIQLAQSGELISVEAAEKSKYRTLDRAAIKAVKKASPYNEVPKAISGEPLSLTIPITFRLEK